jgi:hypothetical protein
MAEQGHGVGDSGVGMSGIAPVSIVQVGACVHAQVDYVAFQLLSREYYRIHKINISTSKGSTIKAQ